MTLPDSLLGGEGGEEGSSVAESAGAPCFAAATEGQHSAGACDPFKAAPFGGLPKMGISPSATSIGVITRPQSPNAPQTLLSDPATRSSCAPVQGTLPLPGVARITGETASKASSAPSFGTRVRISRPSLSVRLTRSLIESGLVRGITPSSIRKHSGAAVAVLAFDTPAGGTAAARSSASSSSNA